MKIYKAVHERENKCKELHKEMNLNVGPTRLVQPDFYLLVDVDDIQRQMNALENEVHRIKRAEVRRRWRYGRKNIKITINVECSEKSSVKKEQIAGYLLRAIAGVTANNKCLITNYVCEINEKNDDKLQEKYITGKPKLTKDEKSFLDGLDPSWSYMLRNGKGQLYLARKDESMYGSNFKYLYLEGITNAKFDFVEAEGESWLISDLKECEVEA